jgi:hypothetical protein
MTSVSGRTREERLAVALKENLKRRKAQAKAKACAKGEGGTPTAETPAAERTQHRPKSAPKEL